MSESKYITLSRNIRSIADPEFRRFAEALTSNIDNLNRRITELEAGETVAWRNFTMQNSWTRLSLNNEQPQFWKDRNGWVHIKGEITGGTITNGTVITTLPAGYRPRYIWPIITGHNGTANSMLLVNPAGNITCLGLAGNTRISMAGEFYAQL